MTAKEKICNDFVKEYSAFLAQFGMHVEINNKLIGATTGLFAKHVTPLLEKYASQSKWVSCAERLPDERMLPCLVANMDAPEYNQHVFLITWYDDIKNFSSLSTESFMGTITHWMPLPSPPVEKS